MGKKKRKERKSDITHIKAKLNNIYIYINLRNSYLFIYLLFFLERISKYGVCS